MYRKDTVCKFVMPAARWHGRRGARRWGCDGTGRALGGGRDVQLARRRAATGWRRQASAAARTAQPAHGWVPAAAVTPLTPHRIILHVLQLRYNCFTISIDHLNVLCNLIITITFILNNIIISDCLLNVISGVMFPFNISIFIYIFLIF